VKRQRLWLVIAGVLLIGITLLSSAIVGTIVQHPPRSTLEVFGVIFVGLLIALVLFASLGIVFLIGFDEGKKKAAPRTRAVAGLPQEPVVGSVGWANVRREEPPREQAPQGGLPPGVELAPLAQDLEPSRRGSPPPAARPIETRVHQVSEARERRETIRLSPPPPPSPQG
jgi:hypothetical protein